MNESDQQSNPWDDVRIIECKYCPRIGERKDVHKGGWTLARNHPFAYVCPHCFEEGKQ